MAYLVDINFRAVRAEDEYDLVDPSGIDARVGATLPERLARPGLPRIVPLLTPPVYYTLTNGIEDNRRINDALIAAANAHPGARAFGAAEPKYGDAAIAEIDRLAALGAAGLVWSPRAQGLFGNDHTLAELCRHAAGRGLVSMVQSAPYTINEGLWRLWSLAAQLGDAPLVVLGALESWENIQSIRASKGGGANIYYDLSAMSEGYDLDHLFAAMGAERLLFGSGGGDGIAATLGVVERSTLPAEARDAILWRNAARLFDLNEARP
jgi:predicted TIM-barrel fold metal-dependent hydrolase